MSVIASVNDPISSISVSQWKVLATTPNRSDVFRNGITFLIWHRQLRFVRHQVGSFGRTASNWIVNSISSPIHGVKALSSNSDRLSLPCAVKPSIEYFPDTCLPLLL